MITLTLPEWFTWALLVLALLSLAAQICDAILNHLHRKMERLRRERIAARVGGLFK